MQSSYRFIIFFFLLSATNAFSQEIELKVNAENYENEKVYLWMEDDFFSRHKTLIDQSTIISGEAIFKIKLNEVSKIRIGIDYQYGSLFVEKNAHYEVRFPERDKDKNRSLAWNSQVQLVHLNSSEEDINIKIAAFNNNVDQALLNIFANFSNSINADTNNVVIAQPKISQRESLSNFLDYKNSWDSIYEKSDSPFFSDYRLYAGATIAYSLGQKRDELYSLYLKDKPIRYDNPEYANFFNQFYQNYLSSYDFYPLSDRKNKALNSTDSKNKLMLLLSEDGLFQNNAFDELVLLKSIYDYYPRHPESDSVLTAILLEISQSGIEINNERIAKNFLDNLKKGKRGSNFPEFNYLNRFGDTANFEVIEGKMIYIQIFASWSSSSLAELELMNELNKRYGANVHFVSLSIDPLIEDFDTFIKNHKKFKWDIGWIGVHPDILKLLAIYDLPLFYLLDQDHTILSWHSLWPSTGIEKVFYEEMLKEKEKNKFRFWEDQTNKSKREE
jgi:thiol-disulfide isomerase/thioredoxin